MIFKEQINLYEEHVHEVASILYEQENEIQNIKIIQFKNYGKSMVLNDNIQSTEKDEFIYHESLIYPAYCHAAKFEHVLSLGGANGGIVREMMKIPEIEHLDVIDIDPQATAIARKYLPHMFAEHEKNVHYNYDIDFIKILKNKEKTWDFIVNDFPDILPKNYTFDLYSIEYFELIKEKLAANGITVFHLGSLNNYEGKFFNTTYAKLKSVFKTVQLFTVAVPSYGCSWMLSLCSDAEILEPNFNKINSFDAQLRYFDHDSYQHMFSLPKYLKQHIKTLIIDEKTYQKSSQYD